jgi:hypothetical protein
MSARGNNHGLSLSFSTGAIRAPRTFLFISVSFSSYVRTSPRPPPKRKRNTAVRVPLDFCAAALLPFHAHLFILFYFLSSLTGVQPNEMKRHKKKKKWMKI